MSESAQRVSRLIPAASDPPAARLPFIAHRLLSSASAAHRMLLPQPHLLALLHSQPTDGSES